jgi:hypothetical protein
MTTFRMKLLSARSVSLDSTFKGKKPNSRSRQAQKATTQAQEAFHGILKEMGKKNVITTVGQVRGSNVDKFRTGVPIIATFSVVDSWYGSASGSCYFCP